MLVLLIRRLLNRTGGHACLPDLWHMQPNMLMHWTCSEYNCTLQR